jgi:hypothetical protein
MMQFQDIYIKLLETYSQIGLEGDALEKKCAEVALKIFNDQIREEEIQDKIRLQDKKINLEI